MIPNPFSSICQTPAPAKVPNNKPVPPSGDIPPITPAAAGVIGGISPLGGTGLLLGTFAGAGVWQMLENGLGIIGAPVGIQRLVIGVIVTAAVLMDILFRQGSRSKKAKE